MEGHPYDVFLFAVDHQVQSARRIGEVRVGIFAHRAYIDRHGAPEMITDPGHTAIGYDRDSLMSAAIAAINARSELVDLLTVASELTRADRLNETGGQDYILDLINAAAFFAWANRLMLSLGEPEVIGT